MNSKWITRGIPVLVAILVIAMGMMSCSSDPMSSNNNDTQTYAVQPGNKVPDVSTPMEAPVRTSLFGNLKLDPSGGCWFLIEKPTISYELCLTIDILKPKDEGRLVTIYGIETTQIGPQCSEFHPVFQVNKIMFKKE